MPITVVPQVTVCLGGRQPFLYFVYIICVGLLFVN